MDEPPPFLPSEKTFSPLYLSVILIVWVLLPVIFERCQQASTWCRNFVGVPVHFYIVIKIPNQGGSWISAVSFSYSKTGTQAAKRLECKMFFRWCASPRLHDESPESSCAPLRTVEEWLHFTQCPWLLHTQDKCKNKKGKPTDYVYASNKIRGPNTKHTNNHVWLRLITIIQVEGHADLSCPCTGAHQLTY